MLWHAVNHGPGQQIPIKASALKLEARRFSASCSANLPPTTGQQATFCHCRRVGQSPLHFLSLTTIVSNVNKARKQHPWRELKQTHGYCHGEECAVRRRPGRQNARAGRKNIVTRSFTRICPATAGENDRRQKHTLLDLLSVFEIQPHESIGRFVPSAIVRDTIISLKDNVNCKHGTVTPNSTYTLSSRLVAAPSPQTVTNIAPSKRAVCAFNFQYSDVDERKDLASSAEAAAVEVLADTISENDPASALPSGAPR
jgi:hypothetical protein